MTGDQSDWEPPRGRDGEGADDPRDWLRATWLIQRKFSILSDGVRPRKQRLSLRETSFASRTCWGAGGPSW